MDEATWLACTDPQLMLEFLRGKVSDRKLRLFAVACCRRVWQLLTDERSRRAVEAAERYADGAIGQPERRASRVAALDATSHGSDAAWAAQRSLAHKIVDCLATRPDTSYHRGGVPDAVVHETGKWAHATAYEAGADAAAAQALAEAAERREQASLLHDMLGNPFRPVIISPNWLTSTVVTLAQAIYAERAFDRLGILADALEEGGCTNQDILDHCRQPGEHVRGCWALDLLTGRE